jgi:hypothetical protein
MGDELKRIEEGIDRISKQQLETDKKVEAVITQLFTTNNIPGLLDRAMENDEKILRRVEGIESEFHDFVLTRAQTCPAIKTFDLRKDRKTGILRRKQDIKLTVMSIIIPAIISTAGLIITLKIAGIL